MRRRRRRRSSRRNEIDGLVPALVAAFDHFLEDPVRRDPGCAAKAAIADALYRLNAPEVDVYQRGIRHVQLEPVYGGKQDTAVQLRGTCGLALVRVHHPDYLIALAELLADREAPARRIAAQALGYSENPAAQPLLRLKALLGDEEPQVLSECLLALLAVAPDASLDFVAGFLDRRPPDIAEAAALALGGSRHKAALPLLRDWWERTFDATLRRTALLAIAMLKSDEAIAYLIEPRQRIGRSACRRRDRGAGPLPARPAAARPGRGRGRAATRPCIERDVPRGLRGEGSVNPNCGGGNGPSTGARRHGDRREMHPEIFSL